MSVYMWFKSPNKRLEMPGIEPVNPSLPEQHHICREREREGEKQTDIQTNTCIDLDRQTNKQIDRHTEKCNRHTQRHCPHLRVFNMRGSSPAHPVRERSGLVVECLTRDREAAGSSLTGVTALWSLNKTHLS